MPCRYPRAATLVLALCAVTVRAHAWNSTGHMAVADIAYDNLLPGTKARVNALLAKHRDYGLWMRQMPAGYKDKARFAFMKAATWPDDVRRTPDDRPTWHYIDIPIVAPGYTPASPPAVPTPNAETQITAETRLLTQPGVPNGDRAVALCWVEHLVGDIHQPLHAAALFSATFPNGDKGGNTETLDEEAVADDPLESEAHPSRLHALWDDLLGMDTDPTDIQRTAAGLETTSYGRDTFPQLIRHRTVHDWVLETNALAQEVAYEAGMLPMTPQGDPGTAGATAQVTLPPAYLEVAHAVANRQIALAGLRLADTLDTAFGP